MVKNYEDDEKDILGLTKHQKRAISLFCVGAIIFIILFNSFYIVGAGERAVLLTFGNPSMSEISEGLHLKIPIVQSKVIMDIKTQKYEADLTAASQDLQNVNTKIAINYHIVSSRVPEIYKSIGINYADKVIYPYEQEANKAATAQFTAEQLITNREKVREQMKTTLATKLEPRGIIIEEISIIDFQFSPSFSAAIEAKVTAEQSALAAKNKLAQVEFEAQQRIAQAQGEAEALRLQKQQVSPELLELRQIEVQRALVDKWNGIMPIVLGSGSNILDISSLIKPTTTA